MTHPLNRHSYENLVDEDIAWLEKHSPNPHSLEMRHIIDILRRSVVLEYDETADTERARIVAWLRAWAKQTASIHEMSTTCANAADCIERGEHLK